MSATTLLTLALQSAFLGCVLSGLATASVRHVPADHPTIQAAITASVNGDMILVAPGTYFENIVFAGKLVSVVSEAGPAVTTIDGQSLDTVVRFSNGETSAARLEGFTITHGVGSPPPISGSTRGGGVSCSNGSSPTIKGNVFTANFGSWGGGVMCVSFATPLIIGNEFHHNTSVNFGGAIMLNDSAARIEKNDIHHNNSGSAGGIYVATSGLIPAGAAAAWIIDNTIRSNSVTSGGAGIAINNTDQFNPSFPRVAGNTIELNTATIAGGLWITRSSPTIERNVIRNNSATTWGGGLDVLDSNAAVLRGNEIVHNTAGQLGGGLMVRVNAIASFFENTIADNQATQNGGGLYVSGSSVDIHGTIIADNTSPNGPAAYLLQNSHLSLAYTNLENGASGIVAEAGSTLTTAGPVITSDPLFVAAAGGDYRLQWGSPCIDAGDPNAVIGIADVHGVVRPVDGNLDTVEIADIGACEFAPLYLASDPHLQGTMVLECSGEPGSTFTLWLAQADLVSPATTPFGQYDLPPSISFAWLRTPASPAPVTITRGIRLSPSLIGQRISIQGIGTSSLSPSGSAWTNPITFMVGP